jgi:hypothetical protein
MFEHLSTAKDDTGSVVTEQRTRVLRYLEHVLHGGRDERPLCPFVPVVHQRNGYWLTFFDCEPTAIVFSTVVAQLVAQFCSVSPAETTSAQAVDPTTIIAAFPHLGCMTEAFGATLESARNAERGAVLARGLMLAHMTPFHADPKGGAQYVSAIPLLMVRRMHQPDVVFMKTPDEIATYQCFFPNTSSGPKN